MFFVCLFVLFCFVLFVFCFVVVFFVVVFFCGVTVMSDHHTRISLSAKASLFKADSSE